MTMEDGPQTLAIPPATLEPISRPSSTSTVGSVPQLPGISSIASGNPEMSSRQVSHMRTSTGALYSPSPSQSIGRSLPAMQVTSPIGFSNKLVVKMASNGDAKSTCNNCSTSTTPLWRRDDQGSVLCNACGLFLKLHGRPRPISLKTDVIKSRNRAKTKPTQRSKLSDPAFDPNSSGFASQHDHPHHRQASHKPANGHLDNGSPSSRAGTPSMYHAPMAGFPPMEDQFQSSPLPSFNMSGPSLGGTMSAHHDDHRLDTSQTHEQLLALISSLKTRVSELELINELFRTRLRDLEFKEASEECGQEISRQAELQLRTQLDAANKTGTELRTRLDGALSREDGLKRRLEELGAEFKDPQAPESHVSDGQASDSQVSDSQASDAQTQQSAQAKADDTDEEPEAKRPKLEVAGSAPADAVSHVSTPQVAV